MLQALPCSVNVLTKQDKRRKTCQKEIFQLEIWSNKLFNKIKKTVKGVTVSTDIIVGFPGETEEDFLETLDLVNTCKYDNAFTFIFSARRGTPAEKLKDNIGVIILCPYQHLVEQWVEDIKRFNVTPLICYSKYDWKKKFKLTISDYKLGVIKNFCAIMVNASYSTDYVQDILRTAKGNLCIVVDEAHNFGAKRLQKCMLENFKYRLALSATLERHHDEEGTQSLYNYFKKVCITFTLEDAIKQGFLTPYYYHPVVVNLEPDELQEYTELTEKIINILRKNPGDELPKSAEMLLIKRARIIAGARNKLHILEELMEEYKHDNNILVYCGATKVFADREDDYDEDDARQIERVVDILGNKLNMRVSMFTSKEDAQERERIKESFAEGHLLQALVAIKCLDEGVNIPGIRTAFIMASSTNPKEYVQRRGRVLRRAKGKQFAVIYDKECKLCYGSGIITGQNIIK